MALREKCAKYLKIEEMDRRSEEKMCLNYQGFLLS